MDDPELDLCLSVNRELQRQLSEIRLSLSLAASVSHKEVMEQLAALRTELADEKALYKSLAEHVEAHEADLVKAIEVQAALIRGAAEVMKNYLHHDDLSLEESYLNDDKATALLPRLEGQGRRSHE